MESQTVEKKEKKKKFLNERFLILQPFDWKLILAIVLINVIGMVMIYSASYYYAEEKLGLSPTYFIQNQVKYFLIGIVIMFAFSFIRWQKFGNLWLFALIAAVFVVVAVKLPGLGYSSHGANRWIKIGGFTLQVAEVAKVFIIFGCSGYLVKKLKNRNVTRKQSLIRFFFYWGGLLLVSFLIFKLTNNLSSAFIVFCIGFFLSFMSSKKPQGYLIAIGLLVLVAIAAIIYFKFSEYREGEDFRFVRIRAWLDPSNPLYSSDEAYQSTQGFYAIASGGFFGKGLGQSLIKFTMPEPHNDYILAIMFEEVGLVGVLILTILFIYVLYKLLRIYAQSADLFMRNLALGVFIHIATQVTLNYCVVLGFFPTTGVTLPFISAGGSSLIFLFIELGFVLSADRQRNENQVYREAQEQIEKEHPEYLEMKKAHVSSSKGGSGHGR